MDRREEKNKVIPVEELTQITLDPHTPDRVVSIGSLLEPLVLSRTGLVP